MSKTKENTTNKQTQCLSSLDYGNSFDYVDEYYINSFDYILDDELTTSYKKSSHSGCRVVSADDSINIIHSNGSEKHIQKKKHTSASDLYNRKKTMKDKEKQKTKRKQNQNKNKPLHNWQKTEEEKQLYKNRQNSHKEVFDNNEQTEKKDSNLSCGCLLFIIIIFGVLSELSSCISLFLD